MSSSVVDPHELRPLAEHLQGRSYRDLARLFGPSHETMRTRVRAAGARVIDQFSAHLDEGTPVLVVIPFQREAEWRAALALFQFVLDGLRERGWRIEVVSGPHEDGLAFLLTEEEP